MYLSELYILNFRSCKQLHIAFEKDVPNIFIGINDCGKTSLIKAIGLLLEDKPSFHFLKDNSSKKDFSNSPLTKEEFEGILNEAGLPLLAYTQNETVVIGKLIIEQQDIDVDNENTYSNQILWAIENAHNNTIWLARVFESNTPNYQTFLLLPDYLESGKPFQGWQLGVRELDKKIKELIITPQEIENENKKGRFSNLEKLRAIYNKATLQMTWSPYRIEKADKSIFPTFRYLDWNSSLEDIKKTATDAMATTIEAQLKPLKTEAFKAARRTEEEINKQLEVLQSSIAEVLPNVTAIKTKVFFDVKETVTDILINKEKSDGDIHLDLQGEGVKRQIWFALIKSGALASISSGIKNKKFIWAFDEPETHLYPSAQRQFFEIIKEVSFSNVQSFICTHSTIFIDKSKLKNIKNVSLADHSYTTFSHCATIDEIFDSLDLRNSDFLFYDKFLIIEGDTESYLIPAFYKIYTNRTLEEDNIQVINLTGKNKWIEGKKAVENVLRGFKKSFDYVVYLFDADMQHDLGVEAITDNFFFVGRQDIEDAIPTEVWQAFVNEATEGQVEYTKEEIEEIINSVSPEAKLASNEKFFKQLERSTKQKLSEKRGEQITWELLPSKGNDEAQLILKHLKQADQIPNTIKVAFDKLQFKETTGAEQIEPTTAEDILAENTITEEGLAISLSEDTNTIKPVT